MAVESGLTMAPTHSKPIFDGITEREWTELTQPICTIFDLSTAKTFNWAKFGPLRPNEPKDYTVKLACVDHPDEIYVVRADAEMEIQALNSKLDSFINEQKLQKPGPDNANDFRDFYEVGICVAAKDFENSWGRAVIINKKGEDRFDVFFVDQGDTQFDLNIEDLFPLDRKLVEEFPFQAIALKLDHIAPTNPKGWTQKVVKLMDAILLKAKGGNTATLEVIPLTKLGNVTNGASWYGAMIFYGTEYELGEFLASGRVGMAQFKDAEAFEDKKNQILDGMAAKIAQMVCDEDEENDSPNPLQELHGGMEGFDFYFGQD